MQKPSIGRIVMFTLDQDPGKVDPETYPAMIVNVNSDTDVDLQVFMKDQNGTILQKNIIQGPGNNNGTWQWPVINK